MESDTQAYLLVLKSKDGKLTVLEFENENFLNGKLEAAVKLGIWCQRLNNVEELDREEFQGAKFFDMRDPVVCKIFYLEQWIHFFQMNETVA
ncbi:MAG: hypothetical protein G3M70_17540 [Candidatus Nitronauta litoralis]|uniref:Uncharacterized protein n=1 Tax=Candidatus Nitronauta litoralis TaxID=2705533 RepID=A0A7T0BZ53_9BACT|nr:MAG: hypothetical protein G3M70_17540 [Candidatus Nitronauta litoralis]